MAQLKYVDWDGLVYYDGKVKAYIDDKMTSCLKMGGHIEFQQLPPPSYNNLNYIYKITDEFTSNEHFVSPGYQFNENTWIQVVDIEGLYKYNIFDEADQTTSEILSQLDALNVRTTSVENNIETLESGINEAHTLIAEVSGNLDQLSENVEKDRAEVAKLDDKIDELQQTVLAVFNDNVATTKQVAENTAELGQIQDRVRNLEIVTSETSEDLAAVVEQNNLNKVQIEDLLGIATTQAERVTLTESRITTVEERVSSIETTSSSYATKDDLETLATKEELDKYSTTDQVNSAIATAVDSVEVPTKVSELENDAGYLTEHQDLSDYALKSEIPTVPDKVSELENDSGYITAADIPEVDLSNYYNKSETETLVNETVNGIDISGKADTDHKHDDVYATIDHQHNEYAASSHNHDDTYADKAHKHDEYLTADELTGYSKFSGSYNDLTDKPDIESLAKTSEVEAAIDALNVDGKADVVHSHQMKDITDLDLSQYATKDDLETLATPIFTDNYVVGTPVGGFVKNESVQNLTVAQILTKLLSLTLYVPPVVPEGSTEVVEAIISNSIPMYSQDEMGNLVVTEFENTTWTTTEAAVRMDGVSTFYTIVDDENTVVESGYQEATEYTEEAWLTVALPDTVTVVKLKIYDPDAADWVDVNCELVQAEEQTLEDYTIWTVPEEYEIMSGSTFRFVIVE